MHEIRFGVLKGIREAIKLLHYYLQCWKQIRCTNKVLSYMPVSTYLLVLTQKKMFCLTLGVLIFYPILPPAPIRKQISFGRRSLPTVWVMKIDTWIWSCLQVAVGVAIWGHAYTVVSVTSNSNLKLYQHFFWFTVTYGKIRESAYFFARSLFYEKILIIDHSLTCKHLHKFSPKHRVVSNAHSARQMSLLSAAFSRFRGENIFDFPSPPPPTAQSRV